MKYDTIIDFFKIHIDLGKDINLLVDYAINEKGFKALLRLDSETQKILRIAMAKLYRTGDYSEYELAKILNTLLINIHHETTKEFLEKWLNSYREITSNELPNILASLDDTDSRNFLYIEEIWFLPIDQQTKALRIYKSLKSENASSEVIARATTILKVPIITKNFRDYEINVLISKTESPYALDFLTNIKKDQSNMLNNYTFEEIQTILDYLNSIKEMDESINEFALEFLRSFRIKLFISKDRPELTKESITEIINLFFLDNNIHFDILKNFNLFDKIHLIEQNENTKTEYFQTKKDLIDLIIQNYHVTRFSEILITSKTLSKLSWEFIIEFYHKIESKPISNPACENLLYNSLSSFFKNDFSNSCYPNSSKESECQKKLEELINVTEYTVTVEEYLKKCDTINELLHEIKQNDIKDVELTTQMKIYRHQSKTN